MIDSWACDWVVGRMNQETYFLFTTALILQMMTRRDNLGCLYMIDWLKWSNSNHSLDMTQEHVGQKGHGVWYSPVSFRPKWKKNLTWICCRFMSEILLAKRISRPWRCDSCQRCERWCSCFPCRICSLLTSIAMILKGWANLLWYWLRYKQVLANCEHYVSACGVMIRSGNNTKCMGGPDKRQRMISVT